MNTNILDTIDMHELGKELQQARVKRGLTQEDAASIINVARTTMTAIEKGERRIKADELIKLAQAYDRQIGDFVRSRPKFEPIQVQFRGLSICAEEDKTTIAASIDDLEELCRNYLELEQITGSPLIRKYPLEYEITGLPTAQAAESIAIQERHRLGLGDGPIPTLRDILEQDMGLRIFYLPLRPPKVSAIYFYADPLGGCIAINNLRPAERRRWSLARNYAYFLVHRYQPTVFIEEGYQRLPESERFAESFARSFLIPTSGLIRHFNDIHRTKGKITPADLCTLAHYYGISVAEITLRLEDMKLLPGGIWEKLRAGGLKVPEAQQQLDLETFSAHDEQLPIRYQYLAIDAFDRALITEGQFAGFLRVDRLEARHIAELLRQYTQDVTDGTIIGIDMTQPLGA
ncbi:MAG TPA: XRE family transcriptional regulator [Ktedonobacteraceae bacterium]|jgi:Zn-dependent peptidase ImmA (M78 family)/DNA-binding XRE family transcriptional regulator|nr:XRE family transcriptional regulator [Ktedonobacteraceae bacterium]